MVSLSSQWRRKGGRAPFPTFRPAILQCIYAYYFIFIQTKRNLPLAQNVQCLALTLLYPVLCSPLTTMHNVWDLLVVVIIPIIMYTCRDKPQRMPIIHGIRSACVTRYHFRFAKTYSYMPPDHRCNMLTFQFSHQRPCRLI